MYKYVRCLGRDRINCCYMTAYELICGNYRLRPIPHIFLSGIEHPGPVQSEAN